jgi:hypothetical protein
MKRGRIGKKQREADLRHKRRAQVAGEWLTAAKTPPKAIPGRSYGQAGFCGPR